MKKTYMLGLCLALAGLTIVSCDKKADEEAVVGAVQEEAKSELKIAFVEIDSVSANYQLCKDLTEIANMEGENIQKPLEDKQRALQNQMAAFQKKYESNGFTSQQEFENAQSQIQRAQQDLEQLNNRLTQSYAETQAAYMTEITDSLKAFIKRYNKEKKYDFILVKSGDNILYANAKYDITKDVVKGLNKRYKVKSEVAEKLKKAGTKKTK